MENMIAGIDATDLDLLLAKVHRETGYDFREYKCGTVARRLERRLHATGAETYSDYMEFLDIVDDEVASSTKIINDLLGFSRVGKSAVSPTRIKKVIDDALSRLAIPENIEVVKKLDADLPEVNIDTDQIRQVLVNIIMNAVQAMPGGG